MTVSTLDRRSFFQKLRSTATEQPEGRVGIFGKMKPLMPLGNQELPLVPPPTTTITLSGGLEPYAGPWTQEEVAHLLRRTCFGVKKSDLDLLMGMTMDAAVNKLLGINEPPYTPPPAPINNYSDSDPANADDYDDPAVPAGQSWVTANYNGDAEGYRIASFRGWWIDLMVNQGPSIRERMTLFWHNHFATQTEVIFYGKVCYTHNKLLRDNALGNFKSLTKAVTIDPMMLYYLNGYLNSKNAPDENYARELQELFTIGKDNPDHYTEDDVKAAARVLTGWRVDFQPNTTYFNAVEHDFQNKQFSAFYNNTVIPGSIDGNAELDAMLNMIFAKNEVAEYLCRKLYRWFVYYYIDGATEQNVIQPLAQIFRNNNFDILPVMETLLKSTHFFDAVNKGCFIKTPVDIVVGTMRSFNLGIPSNTLWDDFTMKTYAAYFLNIMQMLPGDPPNVAGWQAFRQVPQYYRMWINGDTARNRNFFIAAMFSGNLATSTTNILRIDPIAFAAQFSEPSNPVTLVDEMAKLLLPQPISDLKKTLLKSILLSGLPSDSYWTIAWFDYVNNPSDPMSVAVVNTRLTNMVAYMLLLPEYQLA